MILKLFVEKKVRVRLIGQVSRYNLETV